VLVRNLPKPLGKDVPQVLARTCPLKLPSTCRKSNPSKAEERETGMGKIKMIQTQDLATTISEE
jgi:hypothetical protein